MRVKVQSSGAECGPVDQVAGVEVIAQVMNPALTAVNARAIRKTVSATRIIR